MQKIKTSLYSLTSRMVSLVVVVAFLLPLLVGGDVSAGSTSDNIRDGVDSVSDSNTVNTSLEDIIQIIINTILFIIGIVAVIMIIIGGFRYVVSGGDSGATSSAKNTILYAVIGLVIAIVAYAIVNFVIDTFI